MVFEGFNSQKRALLGLNLAMERIGLKRAYLLDVHGVHVPDQASQPTHIPIHLNMTLMLYTQSRSVSAVPKPGLGMIQFCKALYTAHNHSDGMAIPV